MTYGFVFIHLQPIANSNESTQTHFDNKNIATEVSALT